MSKKLIKKSDDEQGNSERFPTYIENIVKKLFFGNLSDEEIKQRLYNNLYPYNYFRGGDQPYIDRINNAVNKNLKEDLRGELKEGYPKNRDDIFATYLGIPEDQRHYKSDENAIKVTESPYTPTKAVNKDTKYKKINLTEEDVKNIVKDSEYLNIGENKSSEVLKKYFGPHSLSRGFDKHRGEYISYHDLWDLNPMKGKLGSSDGIHLGSFNYPSFYTVKKEFYSDNFRNFMQDLGINIPLIYRETNQHSIDIPVPEKIKNMDLSMGLGNPISFYDRIYLDDYYNIPEDKRGSYFLPEVVITPDKKKCGGRLIPKHAKGNVVNTNPLPKSQTNDKPIVKKKKLENLDIRPAPGFVTWPRGNTKGYFKMNPYKN